MEFFRLRSFLCILVLLLSMSCVTKRKKGETSALGRFYHNTTAKYNGYFNANEIMGESILTLESNYKDNYNKILPVFPYQAIESADLVKANLDKAIEKVSIDITLHRVSRWADDCYLLLAKAQYLKKDHETAENSFRFLLDEFNPYKKKTSLKKVKENSAKEKKRIAEAKKEDAKKLAKEKMKAKEKAKEQAKKEAQKRAKDKSKSKTNPKTSASSPTISTPTEVTKTKAIDPKIKDLSNEGSKLKPHRPAYWEALIWTGKNLIERGKYYEAGSMFKEFERDPLAPKKLKSELYASYADLSIKTSKYEEAIDYLKKAIQYSKNKKNKARYNYIIGQLYQNQKRFVNSNEYFTASYKLKPNYDMTFHAKLNTFLNDARAGEKSDIVRNGLLKMIRDVKNADYGGEIYYTLAQLSLEENKTAEAESYLNQSLRAPNVSPAQKADSYLELAELYFNKENYLNAKYYYDSTLLNLSKNDPRRKEITLLASNLSDIASNLEVIKLQDSLIKLSRLSVKEKRSLALQIKSDRKNKNVEQISNSLRSVQLGGRSEFPFNEGLIREDPRSKPIASNFFAYDERLKNRGRSEFRDYWGNRILEDNWRRENKNSFTFEDIDASTKNNDNDSLEADLAQILSGIPSTPTEMETAHKKIQEALYSLGVLYREKINNYSRSKETLESLLTKYPNTERKPDALYFMYLDCLDLNDSGCSNSLADKIKYEFPDSRYGKYLTDPIAAKSELAKKDEVVTTYQKAYELYNNSKFDEAYNSLQIIKNKMSGPHMLSPKIALLSAFCVAKTQGKDVYINALRDVVANYPSTAEETKAKEILRFLKGDKDAFIEVNATELDKAQFKLEDDRLHYVVVLLFQPDPQILDDIKIGIADYNLKYHKTENLKMTDVDIDPDQNITLLHIKKFENKDVAMKYYRGAERKPKEFMPVFDKYELYVINQTNYREILKLKSFKEYNAFFKQNYLGQEGK